MRPSRALAGAVVGAVLVGCASGGPTPAAPTVDRAAQARAAAEHFLDRHVQPDGRVARTDQGGDTVSEGQAYAMLLAEVAGRPETAERVWAWTQEHLQRDDELLSFLAGPDGAVRDEQAASDADLLAAWALARSGGTADATELARAVQDEEVVVVGDDRLLTAGPWATGRPATLNPSYWSPAPYEELARRTGDVRWREMDDAAVEALSTLTGDGVRLPPDWARVDAGRLTATAAPSGDVPQPQYGLDAQRTVVWLATACSADARALAARWSPLLAGERASALALALDGSVVDENRHALPLVAAAAAAHAAGKADDRDRLLDEAAATAARFPTYYGDAWLALGRALLQTDLLDACEESA